MSHSPSSACAVAAVDMVVVFLCLYVVLGEREPGERGQ